MKSRTCVSVSLFLPQRTGENSRSCSSSDEGLEMTPYLHKVTLDLGWRDENEN